MLSNCRLTVCYVDQRIDNIFSLQMYAKNPAEHWKSKDTAIYLVTSLAAKKQTSKVSYAFLLDFARNKAASYFVLSPTFLLTFPLVPWYTFVFGFCVLLKSLFRLKKLFKA